MTTTAVHRVYLCSPFEKTGGQVLGHGGNMQVVGFGGAVQIFSFFLLKDLDSKKEGLIFAAALEKRPLKRLPKKIKKASA
jgi:hypothetical protein